VAGESHLLNHRIRTRTAAEKGGQARERLHGIRGIGVQLFQAAEIPISFFHSNSPYISTYPALQAFIRPRLHRLAARLGEVPAW
jgi:hypothetical protein